MNKPPGPESILDSERFFRYRDLAIALCNSRLEAERTLYEVSTFESFLVKTGAHVQIYADSLPRFWRGGKLVFWGSHLDPGTSVPVEYMAFEGRHVALNEAAKDMFSRLHTLLVAEREKSLKEPHV
jgi:hypothetical protein